MARIAMGKCRSLGVTIEMNSMREAGGRTASFASRSSQLAYARWGERRSLAPVRRDTSGSELKAPQTSSISSSRRAAARCISPMKAPSPPPAIPILTRVTCLSRASSLARPELEQLLQVVVRLSSGGHRIVGAVVLDVVVLDAGSLGGMQYAREIYDPGPSHGNVAVRVSIFEMTLRVTPGVAPEVCDRIRLGRYGPIYVHFELYCLGIGVLYDEIVRDVAVHRLELHTVVVEIEHESFLRAQIPRRVHGAAEAIHQLARRHLLRPENLPD